MTMSKMKNRTSSYDSFGIWTKNNGCRFRSLYFQNNSVNLELHLYTATVSLIFEVNFGTCASHSGRASLLRVGPHQRLWTSHRICHGCGVGTQSSGSGSTIKKKFGSRSSPPKSLGLQLHSPGICCLAIRARTRFAHDVGKRLVHVAMFSTHLTAMHTTEK